VFPQFWPLVYTTIKMVWKGAFFNRVRQGSGTAATPIFWHLLHAPTHSKQIWHGYEKEIFTGAIQSMPIS